MPRPHVRHGELVQGVWRHQAVRGIVTSDVYLGVAWNGAKRKTGAHERIVTPELWTAANKVKGVRVVGPSGGYTLSGLVRCSSCGRAMVHSVVRGRGYFKCLDQGSTRCPAPCRSPSSA